MWSKHQPLFHFIHLLCRAVRAGWSFSLPFIFSYYVFVMCLVDDVDDSMHVDRRQHTYTHTPHLVQYTVNREHDMRWFPFWVPLFLYFVYAFDVDFLYRFPFVHVVCVWLCLGNRSIADSFCVLIILHMHTHARRVGRNRQGKIEGKQYKISLWK